MKKPQKENTICSIKRVTAVAMKVAAWIVAGAVTWAGVRTVWTIFCSIDFNPILLP